MNEILIASLPLIFMIILFIIVMIGNKIYWWNKERLFFNRQAKISEMNYQKRKEQAKIDMRRFEK